MSGNKAAIRYAKAVLQHAGDEKLLDEVFDDMQSIYGTIDGSDDLKTVLKSPVIKSSDKKEALLKVFAKQSVSAKRLIEVLIENKRIDLLAEVAASYIDLYNDSIGVKVANVTTAVPLSASLEVKILAKVKELTGSSNVTVKNKIDASIIGGFILRIGDLQYNASIANQLGNIKREFSKSI